MNGIMQMLMSLLAGNAEQIMNSNPKFKTIYNQAQQSGSIKNFVMQYAKQNGIDMTPYLDMLRQRGLRF